MVINNFLENASLKGHNTAIQVFIVVKNLQGTVWEEEVRGFEYEVFIFLFFQFMIFQYFTFKLFVNKYFPLLSNMKDYRISVADFSTPTCLYLIEIYMLNISLIFVNLCSEEMCL